MTSRRDVLKTGIALAGASALRPSPARAVLSGPAAGYRPVVTPNGSALPWQMKNGVKEFHLIAEPVRREFAPGMVVNAWGYNGQTPGPTIEAVEGDRVRFLVTNKLPEWTSLHWHGVPVPNGMDGVGGLTQPQIPAGRTMVYEFDLTRSGTFMYHPHADEMVQMAMGMMGFFIVHPKDPESHRVERDFAIMLHAWDIEPGTATPKTTTMTDFNIWTLNSRVFPGTAPLPVRLGDRVRIRLGNLSMAVHPMHLHGHAFKQTATDGGWIPESAQWPMTTMPVQVGTTAVMEFVADQPGDWAFHCHRSHHTMNAMGHQVPNLLGVKTAGLDQPLQDAVPGSMMMGAAGMADMAGMAMGLPENTLPMLGGKGPKGPLEMGGMFTMLKTRADQPPDDYRDPGWYQPPKGSVAYLL